MLQQTLLDFLAGVGLGGVQVEGLTGPQLFAADPAHAVVRLPVLVLTECATILRNLKNEIINCLVCGFQSIKCLPLTSSDV